MLKEDYLELRQEIDSIVLILILMEHAQRDTYYKEYKLYGL